MRHFLRFSLETMPFLLHKFNLPRAVVSFTFDDVPESAYKYGAAMLEHHRLRGTFYISTGYLGQKTRYFNMIEPYQIADLHRRGHEIALHSHAHINFNNLSFNDFSNDLKINKRELARIIHDVAPRNFAYPFASPSLVRKFQMGKIARSSRSLVHGINSGMVDRHRLKSVHLLDETMTPSKLEALFTQNAAENGWLIFRMNDVSKSNQPHSTSFELLQTAMRAALSKGMAVMNVEETLDYAGVPSNFRHYFGASGSSVVVPDIKRPVRFNPPVREIGGN